MEDIKVKILDLPTLSIGLGNIEVQGGGDFPYYKGEYVVVPAVTEQVIDTDRKVLKEDLTIAAIPYAEVANLANGKTVTIG